MNLVGMIRVCRQPRRYKRSIKRRPGVSSTTRTCLSQTCAGCCLKVQGGILGYSSLILNSVLAQIFIFPTCRTVGSGSCSASTSAGMMKMSEVLTWCGLSWLRAQDTTRELSHTVYDPRHLTQDPRHMTQDPRHVTQDPRHKTQDPWDITPDPRHMTLRRT